MAIKVKATYDQMEEEIQAKLEQMGLEIIFAEEDNKEIESKKDENTSE